jgi:hypothetical protein
MACWKEGIRGECLKVSKAEGRVIKNSFVAQQIFLGPSILLYVLALLWFYKYRTFLRCFGRLWHLYLSKTSRTVLDYRLQRVSMLWVQLQAARMLF